MDKFLILNGSANSFIGKFFNFTTFGAYEMMMNERAKCLFVLRYLIAKLMLNYQMTLQEQFQRVVNRS